MSALRPVVICFLLAACGARTPLGVPTSFDGSGGGAEGGMGGTGGTGGTGGGTVVDCAYFCEADPVLGTTSCDGPVVVDSIVPPMMTGVIDMNGFQELEAQIEVCAPVGWTFHVADSNSCNGWGGDGGTTSNDAELHLTEESLFVYRSDMCEADPPLVQEKASYVPASDCATRTLILRDSEILLPYPDIALGLPCLFRINPPIDNEGTPDALWYWGLNRTYADADRNGSGLVKASFCLR